MGLADRLESDRVLCLATDRSDPEGPVRELVASLAARRAADCIELSSLSREEVAALARAALVSWRGCGL